MHTQQAATQWLKGDTRALDEPELENVLQDYEDLFVPSQAAEWPAKEFMYDDDQDDTQSSIASRMPGGVQKQSL